MKKLLLFFAVLLSTVCASAYDFKVNGIYYNILSTVEMTCEVTYAQEFHGGVYEQFDTYKGHVEIPRTVTSHSGKTYTVTQIGSAAFGHNTKLESVYIPSTVTSIEYAAFTNCSKLVWVRIPNSVMTIGRSAFFNCDNLQSIEIPNTVVKIGEKAFWGCDRLNKLILGNSVSLIEANAFTCCNLEIITSLNTTPPTLYNVNIHGGDKPFKDVDKRKCTVYVPKSALTNYKRANGWSEFINIIGVEDEDLEALPVESVRGEGKAGGKAYTLDGREARKGQKGLVIENGRKIIR